ncbi:MAG: hypothetical protein KGJ43_02205 [Acidobacteriota bacterium]|nr:hypothetical protein [Acidobacteriota bacterium]
MGAHAGDAAEPRWTARLPRWLRPLSGERRGRGEQRLVESFALALAGLVLAVATVHDLVREVHIGQRLDADLASWKALTGASYYHNPLIEQDVKHYTTRDIVCANTVKVKPKGSVQVCFVFTGPVIHGRRAAHGGYYLIAAGTDVHEPVINLPRYAYGCFGTAVTEQLCEATRPPGGPDAPLHGSG